MDDALINMVVWCGDISQKTAKAVRGRLWPDSDDPRDPCRSAGHRRQADVGTIVALLLFYLRSCSRRLYLAHSLLPRGKPCRQI